ncbi:hypothetical protein GF386_04520 [Candidatus Pacearchaeota archaeon]|nr:hypothetical protein [Candidatus Pacearchaeota archaeon]MBD3283389.1 hypothetical protein [Candidatus Pacearchaeota archaeon]
MTEKETPEARIDNNPDNRIPKIKKTIAKNPWITSTFVLGILFVILLILNFTGTITGAFSGVDAVSGDVASSKIVDFIESRGGQASVSQVNEKGFLYEVVLSVDGQELPVYITKDGEYLVPSLMPLSEDSADTNANNNQNNQQTPQDVPKSDKPVVELFVMSHCPYGTQAEKGMIPVFELLGDKIDSEIKFVYYAMHGEVEVEEQLTQYCIQKEQEDKYLDYLKCFLKEGNGNECLTEASIDVSKLNSCRKSADEEFDVTKNLEDEESWLSGRFPLFDVHKELNDEYGIGGSPTLVINGQQVSSGRDSASYLSVVCSSFNNPPEECNEELSSASPSAGFGYSESSGGSTDAQCA